MKTIEKVLLVIMILLLIGGVYVGLRNIDFFNVEEVDISVSGPVTNVSVDMQRLIMPLKGRNILEVNVRSLQKDLASFDGVKEVHVKRYWPSRLIIEVIYNDIALRSFSVSDTNEVSYYFIYGNTLEEVSSQTWESFDKLGCVELNPAYAQMVQKWGSDEGFSDMVRIAEHLSSNNLISSMKYTNNNGSAFGRLAVEMSSLNVMLYIREYVSQNRLDETLAIIGEQFSAPGVDVVYDLYANTLVKRT